MSCIPLTPGHRQVLDLLAHGHPVPEHLVSVMEELVQWGWVLRSGELTGVGFTHMELGGHGILGSASE